MKTECIQSEFEFQGLGRRKVEAKFDGGAITSDAGGLLLREVEKRFGIIRRFAACFTDHRDLDLIEHTAEELVAQRCESRIRFSAIKDCAADGLALGYEDLADHDDAESSIPSRQSKIARPAARSVAGHSGRQG